MGLESQTETIADLQAALDAERAVASREAVDALDAVHLQSSAGLHDAGDVQHDVQHVDAQPVDAQHTAHMDDVSDVQSATDAQILSDLRKDLELSTQHDQPSTPEITTEASLSSISMLELAEILDQHRQWVESGGETGSKADLSGVNLAKADLTGVNLQGAVMQRVNLVGADLSMANLRGASLVQADMRDTNLLGSELRGANLMGANLYGAEGVWVGRLGGANLFDAILPETVAAFDSSRAIEDATKAARWFYFLMLTFSAICALLVATTSDVRLILNSSAIPLSRLGNVLPMTGFYLGGPLLLFIAYVRFHFLLLRLWGGMAELPAVFVDGQTLEKDGPWYLMGVVRRHFRWMRDGRSPFAMLESVISTVLAYWVVPAALFLFWLRYLVRQDFRGTLLHSVLLTLSVAAATCLPSIVSKFLRPGELRRQKTKNLLRLAFLATRAALATGAVILLFSLGVSRGLPADRDIAPQHSTASIRRWAANILQSVGYRPYADLTEASLSAPPANGDWSEQGIADIDGARLNQINLRFARAYRAFLVNGKLWRANLEGAYFSEADLRGANMREAILKNAILDRAKISHALLVSSDATGANLTGADLRAADLSYSVLQSAALSNAKLGGASLYAANLRYAQMLRADLSLADLRDTKMEQSVLSFANLQQADLSSAKLTQANLNGAQLKGAILLDADLSSADLQGATLSGAVLRDADLRNAVLSGADLRGVSGLSAAQVCSAHWHGALLDPDMLTAVQTQCPQ
jgi:uncharacterized protein YjbI with pentapeptide repeats